LSASDEPAGLRQAQPGRQSVPERESASVRPEPVEGRCETFSQPGPAQEPEQIEATDPTFEAFDDVCRRLAGFDDNLHTEWVDGYLTAVAASWRAVPLDEVLPRMCGDAFERAFADPADETGAHKALQSRLSQLRTELDPEALLDDPEQLRLAPLMQVWDDTTRQQVVEEGLGTAEDAAQLHTGASWALGFFRALEDFSADWPDADPDDEHAEIYGDLLETVAALAMDPRSDEFRSFAAKGWKEADPTRDELVDEACFAVQDLRVWWIDHPPKRAPLRAAPTPGRNDPCPCGSGRKFKKCHGA
jgi:uncharacterized protein